MGTLGTNAVSININKDVEKYTNESIRKALEIVGLKAESYAKVEITNNGSVDTGLLRNSIAHAVGGRNVTIGAEKETFYKSSTPDDEGKMHIGTYSGKAPKDKKNEFTVYIGTNVEYAPYVEMGHHQQVGRYVPKLGKKLVQPYVKGKPFLKPAILNHLGEYKQIIENTLIENDVETQSQDDD